jgi:thioredoxin reductase (NADPH)
MTSDGLALALYTIPLVLIWLWYARKRQRLHATSVATLEDSLAAGLIEPVSLHPIIDTTKCIGCGSCISACPEMPAHQVLGMVRNKAQLVSPTDCIGHGACRAACPADAISLVFGTEKRGVDIPFVKPNFETNVPGIFVAGELGGMGLIRNAIEQGIQAIRAVAEHVTTLQVTDVEHDLVIIGAGPAGIAASLCAEERALDYVTLEQDALGGTVANFPRGKLVMTKPAHLPLVGPFHFRETSKENLIAFWRKIEQEHQLRIRYRERVESIAQEGSTFEVRSDQRTYRCRAILLAIGRRGTPRKLDVPGEVLPKVAYRLIDPAQYKGRRMLVVGGGDSAIEAAISLAEQPGTTVTLSYRSEAFNRAKRKNRERLERAEAEGRVHVLLKSNVRAITPHDVEIEQHGEHLRIANDGVIVNVGGLLPTDFLRSIGIQIDTKFGTA